MNKSYVSGIIAILLLGLIPIQVGALDVPFVSVKERVLDIKDAPTQVGSLSSDEQRGIVGSILANIFSNNGKILSDYVSAFSNIIGNTSGVVPRWDNKTFKVGNIFDDGDEVHITSDMTVDGVLTALDFVKSDGTSASIAPEGAIIAFDATVCPDGWEVYTPAQGRFLRGIDTDASDGSLDPSGYREPGSTQSFADQRITGSFVSQGNLAPVSGVFYRSGSRSYRIPDGTDPNKGYAMYFDSNRLVTTSTESRPSNVGVLYCKKSVSSTPISAIPPLDLAAFSLATGGNIEEVDLTTTQDFDPHCYYKWVNTDGYNDEESSFVATLVTKNMLWFREGGYPSSIVYANNKTVQTGQNAGTVSHIYKMCPDGSVTPETSQLTYLGTSNEVRSSVIDRNGADWTDVLYPGSIPLNAKKIKLRVRASIEENAKIGVLLQASNIPEMLLQEVAASNGGDSVDSTVYVDVPYSPERKIEIKWYSNKWNEVYAGYSYVDIIGYE